MRVILGSSSPRRRELLGGLLDEFEVLAPSADEAPSPGEAPEAYAVRMAADKMRSLAPRIEAAGDEALVITCDTVVTIDGAIIGKPAGLDKALEILERLSGRTHRVISGLSIGLCRAGGRISPATGLESSGVSFKPLDRRVMEDYLARIEYMDKAGAYAAQEHGDMIIERIDGSISNVIGFPLRLFYKMLIEAGAGALLLLHRGHGLSAGGSAP